MIRGSTLRSNLKTLTSRRFIATANSQTKYTTLGNGVTLATETNPNANSSTLGVYFGAGSRAEHQYNNGLSALTANVLSNGFNNGVLLSTENTRELNGLVAETTNDNVIEAAKLLSKIVSNTSEILSKADLEQHKKQLIAQGEKLESIPQKMITEHLNASAFQGYSLGLPVLGSADSIKNLEVQDSERLLNKHLVSSNVVIAGSGNFSHEKLVEALEGSLKVEQGIKPEIKPASFLGSEVRMRDDTLPKAYITFAAQGEGLSSPAYYVSKVAAACFGDFDHQKANAKFTSAKLASIVQDYHIVDKYSHFSTSYSDTGLWGFNAEISNVESVDEFIHFTLKEWNRLSISISDAEVARAKANVKTAILAELNSSKAITSDIATKVLLQGYRSSVKEILEKIDSIQTKDVKAWAQVALWDKDIVISGTGQIEGLLDYMRWRNEMAMMRW